MADANEIRAAYIKGNEGYRRSIYKDHLGNPTVGAGLNLNDPVTANLLHPDIRTGKRAPTDAELQAAYVTRLGIAARDAQGWLGNESYTGLDDHRRNSVVDMAYQMGGPSVSKFVNTGANIQSKDWPAAADQLLRSKYAQQTPERAYRNAFTILTGAPYDEKVIKDFQTKNGLRADGVVGPKTWSKLRGNYGTAGKRK